VPAADRLRVIYCGGCDPRIDRAAVGRAVAEHQEGAGRAATLFLSGCPRACASEHRLTSDDPAHVVIAGETVEGRGTTAAELAAVVRRELADRARGRDARPKTP
jgi:hypothetical protein